LGTASPSHVLMVAAVRDGLLEALVTGSPQPNPMAINAERLFELEHGVSLRDFR